VNAEQLLRIMPFAGRKRVALFAPPLDDAMREFGISTPLQQAAFLAQVGHESGQLAYVREIASGQAYEGRQDLGNVRPGDGPRFRGRGLIQITGRHNYELCGQGLHLDLIAQPELLEQAGNACRSAAWFWREHGLNRLADAGDFVRITKIINGGTNGLAERQKLYVTAKEVLGC
jgi:putative chitinase